MNFIIDNKEKYIPDITIKEIEQDFGDVEFLYDFCGSIWTNGQCEDCKAKSIPDNKISCGKRYKASILRSSVQHISITLKNATLLFADKILD